MSESAAGEGEREPFLRLAAPAAFPVRRTHLRRHVVGHPVARLAQQQGLGRADFLAQLATGRFDRRLALVDAALRHLPGIGLVQAAADEDPPLRADQHQPDIRPVELGNGGLHGRSCAGWTRTLAMQASRHSKWPMIGTSATPLCREAACARRRWHRSPHRSAAALRSRDAAPCRSSARRSIRPAARGCCRCCPGPPACSPARSSCAHSRRRGRR